MTSLDLKHRLAALMAAALVMPLPQAAAEGDHLRQTLAANDGWAGGTSGGADAVDRHVYKVTNRSELLNAFRLVGSRAYRKSFR